MIITVGNIKGGVGKTTLAVNIAIERVLEGHSVLLVDADEQGTASTFSEVRAEALGDTQYQTVKLHGKAVRQQGRALAENYDFTIIDCGGRDTGGLRASMTFTDKLIIPLAPRSFDLWAIDQMAELVDEVDGMRDNLDVYCVLNMADVQGADNQDTQDMLADYPRFKPVKSTIARRKVWANSASAGMGIIEFKPTDKKAILEFNGIMKEILK